MPLQLSTSLSFRVVKDSPLYLLLFISLYFNSAIWSKCFHKIFSAQQPHQVVEEQVDQRSENPLFSRLQGNESVLKSSVLWKL